MVSGRKDDVESQKTKGEKVCTMFFRIMLTKFCTSSVVF